MRSMSASSPASMRLMWIPVCLVKFVERLVGLVVARRIEVQDFVVLCDRGCGGEHSKESYKLLDISHLGSLWHR
jgi:hypothetical protein